MSSQDTSVPPTSGASAGQKVKGAFQAVHGIGESIRGNAMDFIDYALGTERSGHGATVQGQQETATGVANMEGHHNVGTASVDPNLEGDRSAGSAPVVGKNAPATQTSTTAPPTLPTRDYKGSPPPQHGTAYGTR